MEKLLDVIAATPIGSYPARLKLNISGGSVSGVLSIMGHDHGFSGGTLKGNEISLSMTVDTPLGAVPFTANGIYSGDRLDCSAKTRLGNFRLTSAGTSQSP